jgi:tellurite methyltransferase
VKLNDSRSRLIKAHWQRYYSNNYHPAEPSDFLKWCLKTSYLSSEHPTLEFGCGSGRDSFALFERGVKLLAIDASEIVVLKNNERYKSIGYTEDGSCGFIVDDLTDISRLKSDLALRKPVISRIYSRFFLHAIPETLEDSLLKCCTAIISNGGLMMHEFRTNKDPLATEGIALSESERLTDHYRRFISPDRFVRKLRSHGWRVLEFYHSRGFAILGDQDPFVARVVAVKD